jgi:hypothetical protein
VLCAGEVCLQPATALTQPVVPGSLQDVRVAILSSLPLSDSTMHEVLDLCRDSAPEVSWPGLSMWCHAMPC